MAVYNTPSDYISHYGILGMKWGVRRYQNKDGSYTEAGKKRYGDPAKWSDDYKEIRALTSRHMNELSNAELRKVNDRQNLEVNYKRNNTKKSKVSQGIKYVAATAAAIGSVNLLIDNSDKLIKAGRKFAKSSVGKKMKQILVNSLKD